jgi:hypothetical protein
LSPGGGNCLRDKQTGSRFFCPDGFSFLIDRFSFQVKIIIPDNAVCTQLFLKE